MPALAREIMMKLYRHDIWAGFTPTRGKADVQGWNGDHPALRRLAAASGTVVIDVGVWKGQSTITMSRALKEARIDGCVIAIDTFLGSLEHWDGDLFHRINGSPDLYRTFLANVAAAGVADYVVPLPQTADVAARILQNRGIMASVIHIDAAHDYEAVLHDATDYWKLLHPGGWLIGDDYHASWPDVMRAADEFSTRVQRPLTIEPPKWIVQKSS